jgi:kinesin family protein C2/C3
MYLCLRTKWVYFFSVFVFVHARDLCNEYSDHFFHSCQTAGSGKTFTMEGRKLDHQYGISQRTIQKIFSLLQEKAQQHQRNYRDGELSSLFHYKIEVGMLEIYNDEVYDLLDLGLSSSSTGIPRKKTLDIRLTAENTVEVPGLVKESVSTVTEVLNVLDRGNSNRATASTNLNEHSSRSHMVLQVEVTSGLGEAMSTGTLYLVDLAGSERVRKSEVEGKELKEAQHINKSLSALGNVMEALDRKASHVPYRDSKLTYLLQNSLGGNSRTMMVVTVCPHNNSYDETTYALKFATRVRRINLGSAQKNVRAKNLEETVKNLISEMQMLSKAKERSESQLLSLKREKERVEEKLSKASHSRANSKEEMRNLSFLRQANDDITSRWQKEKIVREEKTSELGKVQDEVRL